MNNNLKSFTLSVVSLIISGILAWPFGKIYELIIQRPSEGGFWGPNPLLTNGFVISLFIFYPLLLSFGGKYRYYYITGFVALFIILFWGYLEGILILFIASGVGLVLGYILNKMYPQLSKKL